MTWVKTESCITLALLSSLVLGPCPGQGARSRSNDLEQRRTAARNAELNKTTAIVRGRCVDTRTLKPLAGCRIELRSRGRSGPPAFTKELDRAEPATTGADGRFALRILAREQCWVDLEITHKDHWPRTARWYSLEPGEVYDVGTARLHRGTLAHGKVVNEAGHSMPGVSIGILGLPLSIAFDKNKRDSNKRAVRMDGAKERFQLSGADGSFESRDALPPGTYQLHVAHRGVELVKPKMITVPDRGPMPPVDIVLREQSFISGVVVDDAGRPFPNVGLTPGHQGRATAHTDARGRFKVYREGKLPDRVALMVVSAGPYQPGESAAKYAWGTTDAKIVVQRALTLEITVVEAGSTKPVEAYAVRCYPTQGAHGTPWTRLRHSGRHAGGKLVIEGVLRGAGRLTIVPKDPQLLTRTLDLFGAKDMKPIRVEVQRLVPMQIHVRLEGDRTAANVQVQVIAPGNQDDRSGFVLDPRTVFLQGFSSDPDARFDLEIFTATTDAHGRCIVYGIAGRKDLILQLSRGRKKNRVPNVTFGRAHLSRRVRFLD